MRILYPNSGSHPRYCSQQHGTEVWAQRKGKTHAQALVQNSPSPRCVQGLPGPRMRDSPPSPWPPPLEPWRLGLRPHRTTTSEPTTAPRGLCLSLPGLSLPPLVGPGLGDEWVRVVVDQPRSSPSPGTPAHTTPNVALTQKLKHVQGGRGWEPKGKKREKRERGGQAVHANQASRTVV
ncbi:hypothetical protein CABS01_00515 [Colletotrichum abscissum]|uniref:uncharacterized protein n=1 Tax=Colletotrichum abscissum TaxID=1671311 RepID=UPI0027D5163E|nr:uncharacterized protein CABS01_00515 [Colletotrichum abscissum]KAK1525426.1 hypothetical protein CABS01_00515 [Colletotrichum abscissum]